MGAKHDEVKKKNAKCGLRRRKNCDITLVLHYQLWANVMLKRKSLHIT
jgi:hypothetical protein